MIVASSRLFYSSDRRNVGESSCDSGDGTDQRVQFDVHDDELPFILNDTKNLSGGDTYVNIYVLMIWSPLNVGVFKKVYDFCTVTSSSRAAERGFWSQMVLQSSGLF